MQPNPSAHRPSFAEPRRILRSLARTRQALCGATLALCALSGPLMAAPGVPAAPVVVWSEDFENLPTPNSSMDGTDLLAYTGLNPAGQQYTADLSYRMSANSCNGIIAAFDLNPTSANMVTACSQQSFWNALQQMSKVLGLHAGQADPAARKNRALTLLTVNGTYPANSTIFQTKANIPQATNSRFLTGRIDVAATYCNRTHPLLRFALIDSNGVSGQLSPTPVDA